MTVSLNKVCAIGASRYGSITDSSGPSIRGFMGASKSSPNANDTATGSPGISIPVQPGTSSSNDESITSTNGSLLRKSTITISSEPNDETFATAVQPVFKKPRLTYQEMEDIIMGYQMLTSTELKKF